MDYKGFHLDKFQEDSIRAIEKNNSVVVSAPTGSGKTLIADYIINRDVKNSIKVVYTAPIKALSNQKYKEFCQEYGEEKVGLLTGDVVKNPNALILIMTTEIYRNMALIKDPLMDSISYVIFDEIHFINDIERGYIWEESIIFSKDSIRFLCLSATIPNAKEFASWISIIKNHKVEVIQHDKRYVPLEHKIYDQELGITTLEKIKEIANIPDYSYIRGRKRSRRPHVKAPSHIELIKEIKHKVPCFFFCFSRQKCQNYAEELAKLNLFQHKSEITSIVRLKLKSSPSEINNLKSTKLLRRTLPFGIAFHHAGLLPVLKDIVEELFGKGLINVLYTTETFAVGINMPAKSVCFESLRKFDGLNFRFLNSKEYFQIAGRAGRRGLDTKGYVYAMISRRDFDYTQIKNFTTKDVDPIKSQFKLSINTVLNLIKQHDQKEIDEILVKNFLTFQKYGAEYKTVNKGIINHNFNSSKRKLTKLGYVKDNQLTKKGEFSSKIYSYEILTGELFATNFYYNLNVYQMLLLIAAICYEPRERTEFYRTYDSKFLRDLKKTIFQHEYIRKEKRFNHLNDLTAIIFLCYEGKTLFDILNNTNMLEGDIFRFFRQLLDRISQIRNATENRRLSDMLSSCKMIINDCLQDIDSI